MAWARVSFKLFRLSAGRPRQVGADNWGTKILLVLFSQIESASLRKYFNLDTVS